MKQKEEESITKKKEIRNLYIYTKKRFKRRKNQTIKNKDKKIKP